MDAHDRGAVERAQGDRGDRPRFARVDGPPRDRAEKALAGHAGEDRILLLLRQDWRTSINRFAELAR